ncbi:GNAT family N-acetyltransferase [Lactobacillus kitasatonis]|uniref:GNAT family N-acetyltransferase n=1 Tax=Lactobacillus kitasatonis TaxID=237446 RepID=UPI0026F0DB45|nr:GNAT family N-acetyltransferase [Lactobacillus kitasatonis]
MSQIVIRKIDAAHNKDARIPNQPFEIWGRMIPSIDHGKWSYEVEKNEKPTQDCFPDERYNVTKDDATFLGAYDGDTCVGLAVLRKDMFRYLYLDDLKVNRDYRGQGVGGKLIEACMHKAEKLGMQGVYTIGQDTNASACLFYLKHGFDIGGFDNRSYRGTAQEDSASIFFYRDLKND